MIFYYLDASAWVKCYFQEAGSTWMQRLLATQPILACSVLGCLEVRSALVRKVKAHDLTQATCQEKQRDLEQHWKGFVQIHLTGEIFGLAEEAIDKHALRGSDAIHAASAQVFARQIIEEGGDFAMITSDQELKKALLMMNLSVIDPEAE